MDLDATLAKHGTRLNEIESFVEGVKAMMNGANGNVQKATEQLDELLAFKSMIEGALPMIEKTAADMASVVDDLAAVKKDLAPALAWIAEQQKAVEAAKAADTQKAADAAKAHELAQADLANKALAEKPAETPAADPAKPLEHIAEVEASIDEPAARSESETTTG